MHGSGISQHVCHRGLAWKRVWLLVGVSIVGRETEREGARASLPQIKLIPSSRFSCWREFNLPHVTRKHLNISIWIKLGIMGCLRYSQIIMVSCICSAHSVSVHVLLCLCVKVSVFPRCLTLTALCWHADRCWIFSGHILAAFICRQLTPPSWSRSRVNGKWSVHILALFW